MALLTVGVLALQGAFMKHLLMLRKLNVHAIEIRKPEELEKCDALIIPGGESTTMMKQITFINFANKLREFGENKPVFGTCAGLILMSKEIISDKMTPFNWLDVTVERNAFGRQVDSFQAEVEISFTPRQHQKFPAIFIRAPRIKKCGDNVSVLASFEGEPVLIKQNKFLGATFHPELTNDLSVHEYFLTLIKKNN
jgi:pyridoxal 5'-phosphate synthase pdxT subunit